MQALVASSQAFQSNFLPDYKTIHGSVVNWVDARLKEPEGLFPEQANNVENVAEALMELGDIENVNHYWLITSPQEYNCQECVSVPRGTPSGTAEDSTCPAAPALLRCVISKLFLEPSLLRACFNKYKVNNALPARFKFCWNLVLSHTSSFVAVASFSRASWVSQLVKFGCCFLDSGVVIVVFLTA